MNMYVTGNMSYPITKYNAKAFYKMTKMTGKVYNIHITYSPRHYNYQSQVTCYRFYYGKPK